MRIIHSEDFKISPEEVDARIAYMKKDVWRENKTEKRRQN